MFHHIPHFPQSADHLFFRGRRNILPTLLIFFLSLVLLSTPGCPQKRRAGVSDPPPPETTTNSSSGTGHPENPSPEVQAELPTPQIPVQPILEKMVKVYHEAKSYRDNGVINIILKKDGKPFQRKVKYQTNVQRPNKVLVCVDNTVVFADGTDFKAFQEQFPGEIIRRPCPKEITLLDLLRNQEIYLNIINVETNRFSFLPPPLVLLYAKNPLDTFLYGVQPSDISMLPPISFEDFPCYRIAAKRNGEEAVLWIDQASFILRRVELSTERKQKEWATSGMSVDSLTMSIDFSDAEINAEDAVITTSVRLPADAREVENFAPPQVELLGKPTPDFTFQTLDGKKISAADLKGKTAVLIFWSTRGEQFRCAFRQIEEAFQKFKNDKNVIFLAVSADSISVSDQEVAQALTRFGSTITPVRDPNDFRTRGFRTTSVITLFLIDKNGVIQSFSPDYRPNLAEQIISRVTDVLAGKDIYPEILSQTERSQQDFVESVTRWIEDGIFLDRGDITSSSFPDAKIAEKSLPSAFSVSPLWKNTELNAPGNILVVPADEKDAEKGSERIFVLENGRNVTELSADGKILGRHDLSLEDEEFGRFFISAVSPDTGKRFFAIYGKRIYLYDENWRRISRYPDLPLSQILDVLADAVLCDLDGDGKLEMYLSFWDEDGIHKVSPDGKLLARNTEPGVVYQLAPVRKAESLLKAAESSAPAGTPILACTNSSGKLVLLDSELREIGRLPVKDRTLGWIISHEHSPDAPEVLAAMSLAVGAKNKALGLAPDGTEIWSLDMPDGFHPGPVDMIFPVRLKKPYASQGQWLLLGVDSSLHLVGNNGILVDQFNYGGVITGVSSAILHDKPVLLIATQKDVTAMEIQWKE